MSIKRVELYVVFKFINAIYRALIEEVGEDSWDILWRSGELLFEELREEVGIEKGMEINKAVQLLGDYLRRLGMIERMEFKFDDENMIVETVVKFPFEIESFKREAAGPIYIFASMLVSMLNYLGFSVERYGEHYILEKDKLVERWKLRKMKKST